MLNTVFLNGGGLVKKGQGGVIDDGYIRFKDPEVLRVLLANGVDTDGDGGITEDEAAAVTSINMWFRNNTVIETFDEFEKFTEVKSTVNGIYTASDIGYAGPFSNCTSLKSISLPNGLENIGDGSFSLCTQLDTTIPQSVTRIGAKAFYKTSLSGEIYLPMLTTISGMHVFSYSKIEKINLPSILDSIDRLATNVKELTDVVSLGSIEKIKDGNYSTQISGNYEGAFARCNNLLNVHLPDSLEYIGAGSFAECTALEQINIPDSVKVIKISSFYNCTSLVIEDLSLPNLETLELNAFYGVSIKKISNLGKISALPTGNANTQSFGKKDVLEEVVLPDTLTSIADYAFHEYTTITSISANWGSITYIGVSSFREVKGLPSSLSLPSLENALKSTSFRGTNLEEVLDLGSITVVDTYAFYRALSLKKVVLPQTLTSINMQAFAYCNALETVICHNTTPPTLHVQAFMSTNSTFIIYVPDESVTAYREASNWSTYADRIKPLSEYTE